MRVLVTGGSGRVGIFVVEGLLAAGHDVVSLDIRHPVRPVAGVRTILGDVSSMQDAFGALSYVKAEAVVHLAAWSDPGIVSDSQTYSDNVSGTFNVLNVCAAIGVRRAIVASSAQVYGFKEHDPVYARVDERHPLRPLNSYALSKIACEQAADYFARRCGMEALSFRIMGARAPEDLEAEILSLAARPELGGFLLWNRTDARDVAEACALALAAQSVPPGAYNVTAESNALGRASMALLRDFCPSTRIEADIPGTLSILSCEKAKAAFGYAARHAWSLHPDGRVRMEIVARND